MSGGIFEIADVFVGQGNAARVVVDDAVTTKLCVSGVVVDDVSAAVCWASRY